DAGFHVGSPKAGQSFRRGGRASTAALEVEAEEMHREAAQLHENVLPLSQLFKIAPPNREHLIAPPGISADRQRGADMVEDHGRVGKFGGEVREFGNLRMKKPGIEAKTVFREPAEALAEFGVEQQARRKILGRALDRRVRVPHRSAANSPEA